MIFLGMDRDSYVDNLKVIYGPYNVYMFIIEVKGVIWDERVMTHHKSNPHHPLKSVISAP